VARRRLHNSTWGFETNCFVCEPSNEHGMQVPFFHDDTDDVVVGEFQLSQAFSGAPNFVHGGLTMALADEAMAWAAIAIGGKFAVTTEHTTRFLRPVKVGEPYRVVARLTSQTDDRLTASAQVLDAAGKVRAEAESSFMVLSAAQAVDAIGDVSAEETRYLR
jgi:uncharacterized protein (TIGR00369 family)